MLANHLGTWCSRALLLAAALAVLSMLPSVGQAKPKDDKKSFGVQGNGKVDVKWMQKLQATLKSPDEEWRVLEPRIVRVAALVAECEAGIYRDGPKRPKSKDLDKARAIAAGTQESGPFIAPALTDVRLRAMELSEAWFDPEASVGLLRERLVAVQASRQQARQLLAAAREDLRSLLTVRQEAMLVVLGLLE